MVEELVDEAERIVAEGLDARMQAADTNAKQKQKQSKRCWRKGDDANNAGQAILRIRR